MEVPPIVVDEIIHNPLIDRRPGSVEGFESGKVACHPPQTPLTANLLDSVPTLPIKLGEDMEDEQVGVAENWVRIEKGVHT